MENDTMKCAKCGGEMSAGFILNTGLRVAAGPSKVDPVFRSSG